MTLLLGDDTLARRRQVAAAELKPLAVSLTADLDAVVGSPPGIPEKKALLSRVGGRCETDGTELEFDPRSPQAHRCPTCGRVHSGEFHYRWWIYPFQLWFAERALHAATLHALTGEARYGEFASHVLRAYADRYVSYPNVDNVLGPSRLFFSTYLESLWLLQIVLATDLLADRQTSEVVRDRIVEPAADLIAGYDEGLSNRQVWNGAALIAAHAFLGRAGDSGEIYPHLTHAERILHEAVGPDGSWYEGDNYHQFAHRGLWYAVTLGEQLGYGFQDSSLARFDAGFAAPFLTALPDFTYPARKDSRYAASLRQWRFAESCELGLARRDDPVLRWALGRMYADDLAPGDTGRARSSGEAERHGPPVRLSRADLGWRSLLFARPVPSAEPGLTPGSLTVMSQGFSVHRRERADVYVALDWGESGGAHGHPDRLNILFSHGKVRWLDDMGTGSYVDRSLHWYRSTLAHNAPLVDGRSQARAPGELIVAGARGEFEIASARAMHAAPGVALTRTVVTGPGYFIDELTFEAGRRVRLELPVHFDGVAAGATFVPAVLDGSDGLEDGFDFVSDGQVAEIRSGDAITLSAQRNGAHASASVWSNAPASLFRAAGPGQPATQPREFHLLRVEAERGVVRTVWSWLAARPTVAFAAGEVSVTVGGVRHRHRSTEDGWAIEAPGAQDVVFARPSLRRAADDAVADQIDGTAEPAMELIALSDSDARWFSDLDSSARSAWKVFDLGESHYRRSEDSWLAAGEPRARVAVSAEAGAVVIDVLVPTHTPFFVPRDAVNGLDNEQPDINGHGLQIYLGAGDSRGGWVIVPERPGTAARVRRVNGWRGFADPGVKWRESADGFEVRVRLPLTLARGDEFALDVIVNDAVPSRARRRGQLVMSGAAGEFVYLRGDRHDPGRLVHFDVG